MLKSKVTKSSKILGEKTAPGDWKGKLYKIPKSKFSTAKPIETPILFKANVFNEEACWLSPTENSPNWKSSDK